MAAEGKIEPCNCPPCLILTEHKMFGLVARLIELKMIDLVTELIDLRLRKFSGTVEVMFSPDHNLDLVKLYETRRLGTKLEDL